MRKYLVGQVKSCGNWKEERLLSCEKKQIDCYVILNNWDEVMGSGLFKV